MPTVVLIGPKGPSAWSFTDARGVRVATCLNDGFKVQVADSTNAALVTALQGIATHTTALSGAPALAVEVPW